MRDIRGDLQDRANSVAEQIKSVQGQFDNHIEKLKGEHETKLEDVRSALRNVHIVIGIEVRGHGAVTAHSGNPVADPPGGAPEAAARDAQGGRSALAASALPRGLPPWVNSSSFLPPMFCHLTSLEF